jgi:hypothetical protein
LQIEVKTEVIGNSLARPASGTLVALLRGARELVHPHDSSPNAANPAALSDWGWLLATVRKTGYDAPAHGADGFPTAVMQEEHRPVNSGDAHSPPTSRTGDIVQPLFDGMSSEAARIDQEVVELPLLLPRWQAMELEAAASRRGMTTGQMLRRVIGELLAAQPVLAHS